MENIVNDGFKRWLTSLAENWNIDIQDVCHSLTEYEVWNRINQYPVVRDSLQRTPLILSDFAAAARKCYIMGGFQDAVRFNAYIGNGGEAAKAIENLIQNFPIDDTTASQRIDQFIEDAIVLGYSTPNGTFDWAGAAQLASLILTSLYPERFVDYRRNRWLSYAKEFGYPMPDKDASRGEFIIWAGKFASAIASTSTYQQYWPINDQSLAVPNWVISGICWLGLKPKKPEADPIDPDSSWFKEGAKKRRFHLFRERDRRVVAKVKEQRLKEDPLLHCDICGFSFVEKYGEMGKGFIEAHHKIPISKLEKESAIRLEDFDLICSNCHRMIHHEGETLTLAELKQRLLQPLPFD